MTQDTHTPPSRIIDDDRIFFAFPVALALALIPIALMEERDAARLATQLFVVTLIVLAVIDFVTLRVPNLIVYPAILFALVATALADSDLLFDGFIGGAALLGAMFVLAVIGRGAMGMGDVKLACFIGCAMGLRAGFISLLFGFAIGAIIAAAVLLLRLRSRKDSLPLTPFLALGAIINIVFFGSLLTRG